MDAEVDWTVAGQFTVEFHGHILLACYTQALCLKIFNLGSANVGAEHHILQILHDFEVAEPLENNDIK